MRHGTHEQVGMPKKKVDMKNIDIIVMGWIVSSSNFYFEVLTTDVVFGDGVVVRQLG